MIQRFTYLYFSFLMLWASATIAQQETVAHEWNETLLESIRGDFARPTIHARNLWHTSAAMYDIWALADAEAESYFMGNTVDGFTFPFDGFAWQDTTAQVEEAISYAMYRILSHRFSNSPEGFLAQLRFNNKMQSLGYDINEVSVDYSTGSAAALGNYVAGLIVSYGLQDGANEQGSYSNLYYTSTNPALVMAFTGNPNIVDPNRWQRLTLDVFIDQSGNEIPFNTPPFLSPEWGNVHNFALPDTARREYQRDGDTYVVYHDPGPPPYIDPLDTAASAAYKKGFGMVAQWSAHLDPTDGVMIDISPRSLGNAGDLPDEVDYYDYYDFMEGGDGSMGHAVNPYTGLPYEPQMVPRGDYTRVLAEFWADGPDSETPPGHWFTILNGVNADPQLVKRYGGTGPLIGDLEWDVKSYFMLGGAMHDAAISTWGIKGYYDYVRPVSAIRYMADHGQCTDPTLPSYDPAGMDLIDGFVEVVEAGDPLAGAQGQHVGKIKLNAWRGPDYISNPATDVAGVGWILAEEWWPYQRPSFVTPPFAGYVSGHSTFSRAAAEILTMFTGDAYFPGGMGTFEVTANDFLVFEDGPSVDFTIQYATYTDASDQTSLSRIWGGIHPPADDIPGRKIGSLIASEVYHKAETYFFKDEDEDGFWSYEDCDDTDADVYPGAAEICDGLDNDCDGITDNDFVAVTYYLDLDSDGFGDSDQDSTTCDSSVPTGYVSLDGDCDDTDPLINPGATEICDNVDNNCDGDIDEDLTFTTYYLDADGDGYGQTAVDTMTCFTTPPSGYVALDGDCDDTDPLVNPGATEICDKVDNNCDGDIDEDLTFTTYYLDNDGDGYGQTAVDTMTCFSTAPTGYAALDGDCDDTDPLVNPGATEICDKVDNNCDGDIDEDLTFTTYYLDIDGDGYGQTAVDTMTCLAIPPSGYAALDGDCDDTDPLINPSATEVCDDVDNNCDGDIDEDLTFTTYYLDIDGDGYGQTDVDTMTCLAIPPSGYVALDGDCDDVDPLINPGATEVCDNVDNNCDGDVDEDLTFTTYYLDNDGDGYGQTGVDTMTCFTTPPVGYVALDGDCDDTDPLINPGATEVCDDVDNNCDGDIDEDLTFTTYYLDVDGDGYGQTDVDTMTCFTTPPTGYVALGGDCDDTNPLINPGATEVCDDVDNNCDGDIDEDLTFTTYYLDVDGDGFGQTDVDTMTCFTTPPAGYVALGGDCDDTDPLINPGATEVCDNIDNNCDGDIDEDLPLTTYFEDFDGDGFGNFDMAQSVCSTIAPAGYVTNSTDCDDMRATIYPGATEIPDNGVDEDCSGVDLFLEEKVFPNPASGVVQIHYPYEGNATLLWITTDGRLAKEVPTTFEANRATARVSDLPTGVYVLRILGGSEVIYTARVAVL